MCLRKIANGGYCSDTPSTPTCSGVAGGAAGCASCCLQNGFSAPFVFDRCFAPSCTEGECFCGRTCGDTIVNANWEAHEVHSHYP